MSKEKLTTKLLKDDEIRSLADLAKEGVYLETLIEKLKEMEANAAPDSEARKHAERERKKAEKQYATVITKQNVQISLMGDDIKKYFPDGESNEQIVEELQKLNKQEKKENKEKSKTQEAISTINEVTKLVGAIVKLGTLTMRKSLEQMQYAHDLAMNSINSVGDKGVKAIQYTNKVFASAVDTSMTTLTSGVNEGAYAAANALIDNSVDSIMLKRSLEELDLKYNSERDIIKEKHEWADWEYYADMAQAGAQALSATAGIAGNAFGGKVGAIASVGGAVVEGAATMAKEVISINKEMAVNNLEIAKEERTRMLEYGNSMANDTTKTAQIIQKAYLKLAQENENRLLKTEANVNSMGIGFGFSGQQLERFKENTIGMYAEVAAMWGKTTEDMAKMQSTYSSNTGRNVRLSLNDYNTSFALDTLAGEDGIAMNLSSQMELFNHSVADSNEMFGEMYHKVSKMGLDGRKYLKDLNGHLKLAEKYNFKNGVKGLMDMAKWAQNTRFNLNSLGSMLEKTQSEGLEGAIKQAAGLQVLGGSFAMGADPLAMQYESYMDPEGYAKRMHKMLKGFGWYNSRTGEAQIGINEQIRLREFANLTGQDYADVKKQVIQSVRGDRVTRELRGNDWSDEDKSLITNKAQLKNGVWSVEVEGIDGLTQTKSVSELTKEDLKLLKPESHEEEIVNHVYAIRSMMTQLLGVKEGNQARLERDSYYLWVANEKQRMQQVMEDFNNTYPTYLEQIQVGMKLATDAQKSMKDLVNGGNKEVEAAQKAILAEGYSIASTLSSLNTIIEDAKKLFHVGVDYENVNSDQSDFFTGDGDDILTDGQRDLLKQYVGEKLMEELVTDGFEWDGKHDLTPYGMRILNDKIREIPGLRDKLIEQSVEDGWFGINSDSVAGYKEYKQRNKKASPSQQAAILYASPNSIPSDAFSGQISDGIISQNGSITKIDSQDHVLAAKSGGPIDKMLDAVTPRAMPYNSSVRENPYNNTNSNSSNGKIEVSPIQIHFNGNIQLTGGSGSVDISQELSKNPDFIRAMAHMISIEVEKKTQGGKVTNILNRNLKY